MRIFGLLAILGVTYLLMLAFQNIVIAYGFGLPAHFLGVRPFSKSMVILSSLGNAFALYVITGVLVQALLIINRHDQSGVWLVFYASVCAILLYGLTSAGLINKMQEDGVYQQEFDLHGTSLLLKADATKSLFTIPFFIVALLFPPVVINPLTETIFRFVLWLAGVPFLGPILGILGILLAISLSWSALLGISGVVAVIFSAFRRR